MTKKPIKKSTSKKSNAKATTKAVAVKKKAAIRKPSPGNVSDPNTIDILRSLLTTACEKALDAADAIADERIIEAEEDYDFRSSIRAIGDAACISLRKRAPKTKLDGTGEDYVWIDDEKDDVPVPAVAQRADHGGGMSGHDQDVDGEEGVPPDGDGSIPVPEVREPTAANGSSAG